MSVRSNSTSREPSARSFAQVAFRVKSEFADDVAGILIDRGALGCDVAEMSRPGARPRAVVTLQAYFNRLETTALADIRARVAAMLAEPRERPRMRKLEDPGWSTAWQARFKPFRVGQKFLIVPPWHRTSESRRQTIVIQPGRAFGTGHHPTTAAAIRAIEAAAAQCKIRRALDVGTGSGILAIAMAHAGGRDIVAIDVDAEALENARENTAQTGVGARIRFSAVPLSSIRGTFDLIAANILAPTLIEMSHSIARRLAPRGRLILGGILAREANDVMRAFQKKLKCIDRRTVRGWTTLVMTR